MGLQRFTMAIYQATFSFIFLFVCCASVSVLVESSFTRTYYFKNLQRGTQSGELRTKRSDPLNDTILMILDPSGNTSILVDICARPENGFGNVTVSIDNIAYINDDMADLFEFYFQNTSIGNLSINATSENVTNTGPTGIEITVPEGFYPDALKIIVTTNYPYDEYAFGIALLSIQITGDTQNSTEDLTCGGTFTLCDNGNMCMNMF